MLTADRTARALYLYPTKALAQDQARALHAFGLHKQIRPAIYDGDTPRARARRRSASARNLVLTNPDMLHVGILPHHPAWGELFANLAFVVVDEAHVYRGVFGSHVANVLRRLRRIAAIHGTEPRFLLASATIANPVELAERLTGLTDFNLVDRDGAPRATPPGRDVEPAAARRGARHPRPRRCTRRPRCSSELVSDGRPDDLLHEVAQGRRADPPPRRSTDSSPRLAERIAPYRGGYTPQQRQDIQRRLSAGELLGVVATDALELGIDIGELDAAICVTFPGTVASLRQMWGRAGRRGRGLAVYVAGEDALDQFFCRHPDEFLEPGGRGGDPRPAQPGDLSPSTCCARRTRRPLTDDDAEVLGPDWRSFAEELADGRASSASAPPGSCRARADDYPAARTALRSASRGQLRADRRELRRAVRDGRARARVLDRARGRGVPAHGALLPRRSSSTSPAAGRCSSRSAATTSRRPSARA